MICEDGNYYTHPRKRIGMAKASFGQLRKLLTSHGVRTETRMRISKEYVWSILQFEFQSWNFSKELRKRLEAMEMWFLKWMFRVPWIARRTIREVLQLARTMWVNDNDKHEAAWLPWDERKFKKTFSWVRMQGREPVEDRERNLWLEFKNVPDASSWKKWIDWPNTEIDGVPL